MILIIKKGKEKRERVLERARGRRRVGRVCFVCNALGTLVEATIQLCFYFLFIFSSMKIEIRT